MSTPTQSVGPLIISASNQITGRAFTTEENEIFLRDLATLAEIPALQRDLGEILLKYSDVLLSAAQQAVAQLAPQSSFAGLAATSSSQIGMQLIRAVTVMNTNIAPGQTPQLSWYRNFTTTGWQPIFQVNTGQTGLANGGATQLQNTVVLAIVGMIDTLPPKVSEYQVRVENTTYMVESASYLPMSNVYYYKFPGLVYVGVNTNLTVYGNVIATGPSNLQLFGLTFAKGSYLLQQT